MILSQIFIRISSIYDAILKKLQLKATKWSAFYSGFSFLIFLLLTSALLTGCGSTKHIQTVPIENIKEITHIDTIYLNTFHFDSTYVSHDLLTDRSKDTVLIKETNIVMRYQILRDTIERIKLEVRHDSIPYEVRITEVKEVNHIPPWIKPLAIIGASAILVLLIYTFTKLKRF